MSFHIRPHLDRARRLIDGLDDDPASLVYAALELRLGLERVCYEKLKLRLGYVSDAELERIWRPSDVLEALEELADPLIAQDAILHLSKEDVNEPSETWLRVAEQKGIAPKELRRWWNKLGKFLHVQVPRDRNQSISSYPDVARLRANLLTMIKALEPLSRGSDLYLAAPRVSFRCSCGIIVQRTAATLKEGQIAVCINPDCKAEWRVRVNGKGDVGFEENKIEIVCKHCSRTHYFPEKIFRELRPGQCLGFECECGKRNRLQCGVRLVDEHC